MNISYQYNTYINSIIFKQLLDIFFQFSPIGIQSVFNILLKSNFDIHCLGEKFSLPVIFGEFGSSIPAIYYIICIKVRVLFHFHFVIQKHFCLKCF